MSLRDSAPLEGGHHSKPLATQVTSLPGVSSSRAAASLPIHVPADMVSSGREAAASASVTSLTLRLLGSQFFTSTPRFCVSYW